jgi:trehalose 6-phosphate synthase/phosphatase
LIQVISAAPEIPDLALEVLEIAMSINARFSTVTHQLLVLLQEDISYSQFIALLSVADILMSTSPREGLNLACHEYFHCQGRPHFGVSYGSSIVSEFAETGALGIDYPCNPWATMIVPERSIKHSKSH